MRFRVSAKSDTAAPPRRKLGLWMCMALAMGNMIGSGIFLLPASLGPFGGISIAGWAVSSAGAVLLALVFARLSRVVRGTGGPYVFARAGFGELPAFLIAWGYWISTWTTNAALAVAFVSYGSLFWPRLAAVRVAPAARAVPGTTARPVPVARRCSRPSGPGALPCVGGGLCCGVVRSWAGPSPSPELAWDCG